MILAIVDDLFWRSKMDAAAVAGRGSVRFSTRVPEDLAGFHRVLIDLNFSTADPIQVIHEIRQKAPQMEIIGFCSHVQVERQAQARAAGCRAVLPRSTFAAQLPEWLK